jgi:hypothetical protein
MGENRNTARTGGLLEKSKKELLSSIH